MGRTGGRTEVRMCDALANRVGDPNGMIVCRSQTLHILALQGGICPAWAGLVVEPRFECAVHPPTELATLTGFETSGFTEENHLKMACVTNA